VIPLLVSASRFFNDPALSRFQAIPRNRKTLQAMDKEQAQQVLADLAAAIEDEIRHPKAKDEGDQSRSLRRFDVSAAPLAGVLKADSQGADARSG
jgi:hypothetical protein